MSSIIRTAPRASTLIVGIAQGSAQGVWLLPSHVCPALPLALIAARRPFEFIDISENTFALDIDLVIQRLKKNHAPPVVGVIYVRGYGNDQFANHDIARLRNFSGKELSIVDDRCLGRPQIDPEVLLENEADAMLFSTGYGKVLDLGGGGYGFLKSHLPWRLEKKPFDDAADSLLMADYKQALLSKGAMFPVAGPAPQASLWRWISTAAGPEWNSYRDEIRAKLPLILDHKNKLNDIYMRELPSHLMLGDNFNWWRFNLKIKEAASLLTKINSAKLFASNHYQHVPSIYQKEAAENSDLLSGKIVNLFNDFHFTAQQALEISSLIRRHIGV